MIPPSVTLLPPFPTLETERLLLREIVASDSPALLEIHGDAQLMRWFGSEPLKDLDAAAGMVGLFAAWRKLPNPGVRWGLQFKGDATLIGSCGLFSWDRNARKCTLGYELARSCHGKGLMQEAIRGALDWGFDKMDLYRVEAQIHPENAPSLKSIRRLGFFEEGRLRGGACWGGRFHDLLQFSLLRREWMALRG